MPPQPSSLPTSMRYFVLEALIVTFFFHGVRADVHPRYQPSTNISGSWHDGHATFYGDDSAASTDGGACGYGNLMSQGYGTDTAALSTTLFNNGFSCGTCYEIQCVQSPHCLPGASPVTITGTNLCPPNWQQDSNNGGWCNPPNYHFDMAKPAFMKIADWRAGIIPVSYRRVPCQKTGGVQFSFQGNDYWVLVYVMNVAAGGDIASMSVKGDATDWVSMTHNWGASYQAFATLGGQALSFKLISYTTKETIVCDNVAPASWTNGITYQASLNFQQAPPA